jgi:ferritin-like metal-binding protein YciE
MPRPPARPIAANRGFASCREFEEEEEEHPMADVKNLKDLFVAKLRRVYDAEQRLVKALPKLVKAASSPELKHAFQTHFEETEVHVDRLEQIFAAFNTKPAADSCASIKGILKDGEYALDLHSDPSVKDAALIEAAQEAEHFEIAAYGTLRTWAFALDKTEEMQILEVTLEEEKNADSLLTGIARTLNLRAASVPGR